MKRNTRYWVMLILLSGFLLAGCATHSEHAVTVAPSGEVLVADPHADIRRELAGVSGSGPYGWSKGYWTFQNGRWIWVPGSWEEPSNSANWIDGHWERTTDRWIWIPGHAA